MIKIIKISMEYSSITKIKGMKKEGKIFRIYSAYRLQFNITIRSHFPYLLSVFSKIHKGMRGMNAVW